MNVREVENVMVGVNAKPDFDVVVIGAGITGIYQTYLADKAGLLSWACKPGASRTFSRWSAHNGSAFCNVGVRGALQAEWVTNMMAYMRERGFALSEPDQAAEDTWTASIYADFARTLMADTNAWWIKTSVKPDGSVVKRALVYVGGGPEHRKRCTEVAYTGYEGF